jgi:hypothetical protein
VTTNSSFLPLRRRHKINFELLLPRSSSPAESGEGPGTDPEFNLEGEYRSETTYTPMRRYLHIQQMGWMYTCAVGEPPNGWKKFSLILPWSIYLLLLFIILSMVTFGTYFFTLYSPMVCFFGGGGCKDPSHILFSTFIYLALPHLLPPYHLDVPCYLNNRQRYCSVWSKRLGLFTSRGNTIWCIYIFSLLSATRPMPLKVYSRNTPINIPQK